jgi:hypothetical protein
VRGVSHVEFAVFDCDDSIAFCVVLFGWLGYSGFSSLNMEYRSSYYLTPYVKLHSYIGIPPARLLRGVLRRPNQRDSLGAGVGTESSQPPSGLVVLARASWFRDESAGSREHGACRYLASDANTAVPMIGHPAQGRRRSGDVEMT